MEEKNNLFGTDQPSESQEPNEIRCSFTGTSLHLRIELKREAALGGSPVGTYYLSSSVLFTVASAERWY